jgi:hypothetical protein
LSKLAAIDREARTGPTSSRIWYEMMCTTGGYESRDDKRPELLEAECRADDPFAKSSFNLAAAAFKPKMPTRLIIKERYYTWKVNISRYCEKQHS